MLVVAHRSNKFLKQRSNDKSEIKKLKENVTYFICYVGEHRSSSVNVGPHRSEHTISDVNNINRLVQKMLV